MKKALIVKGGWDGHEPDKVAELFGTTLQNEDFEVEISDTLNALNDVEALRQLHLIIPVWTMGEISGDQANAVCEAVADGAGLAGCHGGMCDAFRQSVLWQFITGANWVSHPGGDGVKYTVNIKKGSSPIVEGIDDFEVCSEQYYLQVDPAIKVLATTRFPVVDWYHSTNGAVDVPQIWTKRWGIGRVFYSALGHHADVMKVPQSLEIMRRGMLWAAEGKNIALRDGLNADAYRSDKQML